MQKIGFWGEAVCSAQNQPAEETLEAAGRARVQGGRLHSCDLAQGWGDARAPAPSLRGPRPRWSVSLRHQTPSWNLGIFAWDLHRGRAVLLFNSFIKTQLINNKLNIFKMYNLLKFWHTHTHMWNHYCNQDNKHQSPPSFLTPLCNSLLPTARQPLIHFLSLPIYLSIYLYMSVCIC